MSIAGEQDGKAKGMAIQNRDIPTLQRVTCLMQEICMLEERRIWQKARMVNITQHLSFTAGSGGAITGLETAFAALDETENEHRRRVREYTRALKRAENIINSINSWRMRTFVRMMYLENIAPGKVRTEMNMTERGFKTARRAVEMARKMDEVCWRERYIIQKYK